MSQASPSSSARRRGWAWLAILCASLLALGGCGGETTSPTAADEHWYALYTSGVRVGHVHHRSEQQLEDGRQVVLVEQELYQSMDRFGERFDMEVKQRSVELPDGQLLRFDISGKLGNQTLRVAGQVTAGQLRVEGAGSPVEMAWDAKTGGFLVVEQSLQRQPMQPGEKRTLARLEWAPPAAVTVTRVELAASDYEKVRIRDADVELLRITETLVVG